MIAVNTRYRIPIFFFVLMCWMLTCTSSFALKQQPKPREFPHNFKADMNSPRMKAAVKQAMAERLGASASPDVSYEGWTPKYTRYVGCLDSPAVSTFPDLTTAFNGNVYIGPIQPYTQVKVCSGFYTGGNVLTTSYVAIIGQGSSGSATITCSTTNFTPAGLALTLLGSDDLVQNLSFDSCNTGIVVNYTINQTPTSLQEVNHDEVMHSYFNNNTYGMYAQDCRYCEAENNEFQGNYIGIENFYDVHDVFSGNEIFGITSEDFPAPPSGLLIVSSVNTSVHNNFVSNSLFGIYTSETEFSDIEHNTLNSNAIDGLGLEDSDSGGKIAYNTLDGNGGFGIYVTSDSGAVSDTGGTPNQFLYNKAYHNGPVGVGYDYEDNSYGAPGNYNPNTNDGTANYWHGNKGDSAYPPSILTS